MIQNEEFIQEFVDEAVVHVEKIESALLKKEETRNDKEVINDVFRAVHSIKGTAGFFGLKKIVALGHAMENVFGEIRSGQLSLNDDSVDVLLAANDCLKDMIENVMASEETDISKLVDQLNFIFSNQLEIMGVSLEQEKIAVSDGNKKSFLLGRNEKNLIEDALQQGHHVFEIKLRINKDLLNYSEGPIKLFNKIQSVGMLIDTITNHAEINSFDDILEAIEHGNKDVYLGALVTTILEKELFASFLDISVEHIKAMQVELLEGEQVHPYEMEKNVQFEAEAEEAVAAEDAVVKEEAEAEIEAATFPFEHNKVIKEQEHRSVRVEDNIRVNVSLLNDLLNMASEMVLGRNQLLSTLESYRKTIPSLAPILQNIDRLTSGIQEKIMHTRMQPVGMVFNKFPRIMRDISKNLNKEVDLILQGEDVELDKSMIEALTDPLTHLVRNAADHGLEMPDAREKAGKPRIGTITLKAYHEGGYVNIDIMDDGAGIDPERIKKNAFEKELVSQSDLNKMSEQEILKLIFKPGFSTAEAVTDISGRGVGMDVVRTNIEKLGGSTEIFTTKGIGTTIRLLLPLTLAIIQSLIVEVEGHKFALPQVNLKEIVKIKQGDSAHQLEYIHDSEVLRLRGHLLPIVHLADILGMERTSLDSDDLLHKRLAPGKVLRILVLKMGSRKFGIAVDSILGSEETLVKPLPVYLKQCICYSGVTIMGDGKTSMILDLEGIIRLSDLKFREDNELKDEDEALIEATENQNLLLFKCSGNETFAIDLAMVSRVEEIKASDIEKIGDKEYIKFRNDSLRVIRPEDFMAVNRQEAGNEKLYVIIPKLVSHPMGILIRKIEDNINTKIILNTEEIKVDGLVGSAIYDNRIILIINIYELFEKAAPEHYMVNQVMIEQKKTVLLAEDTPFFQKMERSYLENAGYEVMTAGNGKEALALLEKHSFDVVVSDIQMPLMDGIELVKRIRESASLKHLPVIAVTSMTGEMQKKLGLETGFDYYEGKLDRDSLLKTIEKAISRGKKVV